MAAICPPITTQRSSPLLMAPRLIELCFQTAGIWELESARPHGPAAHVGEVSIIPGAGDG